MSNIKSKNKLANLNKIVCFIPFLFYISGCTQDPDFASVDIAWYQKQGANSHIVQQGESLYAIAFRYDIDYRELAKANSLAPPYKLSTGQHLTIDIKKPMGQKTKNVSPAIVKTAPTILPPPKKIISVRKRTKKTDIKLDKVSKWVWPTKGKIIRKFALSKRSKGIDISGKLNQPVVAAAKGIVVYSGSSLRGYGNLLIIKHTKELFSAYAHNSKLIARENEIVNAGQKIAYLGDDEAATPMLHFEIRLRGKPVNPLKYLPNIN
ncbi:MAG: peptidoglycan DD-metalloendopeptidase family protein [Legionellales bacterium]|nr:peptidoglycan DD-metalloendopeptidase family protein [Legionellales bacterium]